VGKFLIIFGLVIVAAGVLISLGLPLGRLPGDLSYRRGNFSFHFPIVTSIVLSIILTLLFSFLRR
jgi:hypothetical protein